MTHTSTEQPEALRLADELVAPIKGFLEPSALETSAAAELRRLQTRVQELEASQAQRVPLSVVDAIKQGLQADEATRHHCRGTTNWAAAMTRFYERAHGITQEKQG